MFHGNLLEGSSKKERVINNIVAVSYFNTYNRENDRQERKRVFYMYSKLESLDLFFFFLIQGTV